MLDAGVFHKPSNVHEYLYMEFITLPADKSAFFIPVRHSFKEEKPCFHIQVCSCAKLCSK